LIRIRAGAFTFDRTAEPVLVDDEMGTGSSRSNARTGLSGYAVRRLPGGWRKPFKQVFQSTSISSREEFEVCPSGRAIVPPMSTAS
jgi:hypothetical protein